MRGSDLNWRHWHIYSPSQHPQIKIRYFLPYFTAPYYILPNLTLLHLSLPYLTLPYLTTQPPTHNPYIYPPSRLYNQILINSNLSCLVAVIDISLHACHQLPYMTINITIAIIDLNTFLIPFYSFPLFLNVIPCLYRHYPTRSGYILCISAV